MRRELSRVPAIASDKLCRLSRSRVGKINNSMNIIQITYYNICGLLHTALVYVEETIIQTSDMQYIQHRHVGLIFREFHELVY